MEVAHRWSDRNLTRMELVIALLILAVLMGIFARYALTVFGKVEKSMIDRTVLNINTALNYQVSIAMMNQDLESLNQLALANPMDMMMSRLGATDFTAASRAEKSLMRANIMASVPSNYDGVVLDDSDPQLDSGKWFFDQDDSFIFYKINNSEFFISEIEGPARVRYRVHVSYTDGNNNGLFDPVSDTFHSIKLQALDSHEWVF